MWLLLLVPLLLLGCFVVCSGVCHEGRHDQVLVRLAESGTHLYSNTVTILEQKLDLLYAMSVYMLRIDSTDRNPFESLSMN